MNIEKGHPVQTGCPSAMMTIYNFGLVESEAGYSRPLTSQYFLSRLISGGCDTPSSAAIARHRIPCARRNRARARSASCNFVDLARCWLTNLVTGSKCPMGNPGDTHRTQDLLKHRWSSSIPSGIGPTLISNSARPASMVCAPPYLAKLPTAYPPALNDRCHTQHGPSSGRCAGTAPSIQRGPRSFHAA